ncbi:hypothetical protein [Glutamicibacter sp.]|uniref:hypothetical protein n=1 Tax=Glutamicibacter sp. TaxID=1931995 RepID=UPI0028BD9990|nr:hypothetical protein [Glutamicibacter sp.]
MLKFGKFTAATRSEWTKFFSLRSTVSLLLAGIAASVVLGWLLGASAKASGDNGYDTAMPAPLMVFASLQFGQLLFASAAVLHLSGEYSADQMGQTLQSVPRRFTLVAAKSLVVAVVGFIGGVAAILLGTIPAGLAADNYGSFAFSDLATAALGAGAYLALLSLMMIGLSLLCRNSAGSIVAMLMLVVGLPQILQLVRIDWVQEIVQYLPTNAATFLATGAVEPYGPAAALGILVAWAILLLAIGSRRFIVADA